MNKNNVIKLIIFLVIFLNVLPSSIVRDTVNLEHFYSSHYVFEYASRYAFQYGIDIIDNSGPYGYLHSPYTYTGGVFWTKMLWYVLICFIYAYYATLLLRYIRSWPEKLLFLFALIYFPLQISFPWFSYENISRLAVLFSGLYLLTGLGWKKHTHIVFLSFFYALLTLEKLSHTYYIIFVVLTISTFWLLRNQWRGAFWLVGSYLLGGLIFWLAAEQHLLNIPVFFKSMFLFILAHEAVLPQEMNLENFYYGIFYLSALLVLIVFRVWVSLLVNQTQRILPTEIFRSLLIAALVFIIWKHGTLRSIVSFGVFLYPTAIFFVYLCLHPITPGNLNTRNLRFKYISPKVFPIFRYILLLALLGVVLSNDISLRNALGMPVGIFQEFHERLSVFLHYRPAETLKNLNTKLEKLKNEVALPPSLKMSIKYARVDEFGEAPGVLLLNDLNYRPRPIPIDFIAANPALNEKNGAYYQNPKTAPDFVFLPDFGLRLTDTSAYLSLLFNYQAIDAFKRWLVLKKRPLWQYLELKMLSDNKARFDEWISVIDQQNLFLWVNIEVTPTLLARVKSFFYHLKPINLDLMWEDGSVQSWSISLPALHSGFLINPVVKSKASLMTLNEDKVPWKLVRAFRITLGKQHSNLLFHPDFKLRFSVITSASHTDSNKMPIDLSRAMTLINLIAPNFQTDLKR